jgi:hypothetical protein
VVIYGHGVVYIVGGWVHVGDGKKGGFRERTEMQHGSWVVRQCVYNKPANRHCLQLLGQ